MAQTPKARNPPAPWLPAPATVAERYRDVRDASESLARPLHDEDLCIQSMPDASPTKWHLAHTTWFFETFVLEAFDPAHRPFDPRYRVLFNSYYETVGPQYSRPRRGLLSRPTVADVFRYRAYVDERMAKLLERVELTAELERLIEVGLHHEQQHQELILTDIKHAFSCNPLLPAYRASGPQSTSSKGTDASWIAHAGGLVEIGHDGRGFAFDNEGPRHETLLRPFELSSRLVTNGEFVEFIEDGGYERPELWLSAGWASAREHGWSTPAYWERKDGGWKLLTLGGVREVKPHAPVCHVSYYEADAFARWSDARLPTEAEWEALAAPQPVAGNFVETDALHPLPATDRPESLRQMYGDAWEWTASPYVGYPGYRPPSGAIGEYNGKFMCDQWVLRGGSCATPRAHIRATYRNFFPAAARWQFSGLRLARDAG